MERTAVSNLLCRRDGIGRRTATAIPLSHRLSGCRFKPCRRLLALKIPPLDQPGTAGSAAIVDNGRQFVSSTTDMPSDEDQIRTLVDTWQTATQAGDVDTVLGLMTDDAVFFVPGRPPMGRRPPTFE